MSDKRMSKKLMTVTVILIVLLILSAGALAARLIYLNYFKEHSTTTVIPDNLIGEEESTVVTDADNGTEQPTDRTETEATAPTESTEANAEDKAVVLALYKGQASDNESFQVQNLLPGDTEVKHFALKVSHHADVTVYFNAEITEQTKSLADVLHIKVTRMENGRVIYDGTWADMNTAGYGETLTATQSTETVAYYKIEVSLPTTAGNEYQGAKLTADFTWTVKDTDALDPPPTGDNSPITLYFTVMCCSLAVIMILLFFRRREKEDKNAEAK